MSLVNLKIIVN